MPLPAGVRVRPAAFGPSIDADSIANTPVATVRTCASQFPTHLSRRYMSVKHRV